MDVYHRKAGTKRSCCRGGFRDLKHTVPSTAVCSPTPEETLALVVPGAQEGDLQSPEETGLGRNR